MVVYRTLPIAIGLSLLLLAGVADATSTTCVTSTVCAEFINSSSGVAIHGEANTGIGIRGTSNGATGFYGATRSGGMMLPGVEGESLKNNGNDVAGAFGFTGPLSNAPATYGVVAYGALYGVYGTTKNVGTSSNNSPSNAGVSGGDFGGAAGNDNAGVLGESTNDSGVFGIANSSADGALGFPVGVLADGEPLTGSKNAVGLLAKSASVALLATAYDDEVEVADASDDDFSGMQDGAKGPNFVVDNGANITATSLTTKKTTYVRTAGTSGTTRMSYSTRSTAPEMEDFGEAHLVNGRGYVRLDPALSDVIDNRNAYHVFLTPEGDSDILYVTQKTPRGFMVRESGSGRSTLAFEYRIVAKPVDDDAQRLALAPPLPRGAAPLPHIRPRHASATQVPLDPFARLQAHLGPAAYAREIEAARKMETAP
jgi:hypothetical protein